MKLQLLKREGKVAQVACHGEISQLYASLSDPLIGLLGPDCYSLTVILDLQQTTFIETSGIGWLVGCHTRFLRGGGRLILHSLPPFLEDVLVKLVRLDQLLTIRSDATTAQQALEEGGAA
jgi:hypothetical protein